MVAHKKTLLLKRRRVLRTTLAWFYQFQATGRSRISLPRCVLVSIAKCKEGIAHTWTNKLNELNEAGHHHKPLPLVGTNWFSVAGASTTREKSIIGSDSLIYSDDCCWDGPVRTLAMYTLGLIRSIFAPIRKFERPGIRSPLCSWLKWEPRSNQVPVSSYGSGQLRQALLKS